MSEQSGVQRYRPKPGKETDNGLTVAKYEPGKPLDGIRTVALIVSNSVELAEVPLESGPILLVHCIGYYGDEQDEDWQIVHVGDYLAYSHQDKHLFDTDEADLRQGYYREAVD